MAIYATLAPDSPRRADWLKVFGSDRIPLSNSEAHLVMLPGFDGPVRCWWYDVDEFRDGDSVRTLVAFVADRFCGGDSGLASELLAVDYFVPIMDGPDLRVTVESGFYL